MPARDCKRSEYYPDSLRACGDKSALHLPVSRIAAGRSPWFPRMLAGYSGTLRPVLSATSLLSALTPVFDPANAAQRPVGTGPTYLRVLAQKLSATGAGPDRAFPCAPKRVQADIEPQNQRAPWQLQAQVPALH